MPLYEFICEDCQHAQELLLLRAEESPHCESCGSESMQKLLSVSIAHTAKPGPKEPPPGSCGTGCGCFPS